MSHDEASYRATVGMLGSAALPMKEPEELESPEQKLVTLELRLMAEQVENERLRAECRKAKHGYYKRKYFQEKGFRKTKRFSFSLSYDTAIELEEYLRIARKMLLKSPPKGVTSFSEMVSRRIEARKAKP